MTYFSLCCLISNVFLEKVILKKEKKTRII